MFGFTKIKRIVTFRVARALNCGPKSNIRCFVAKSVMSRITREIREGSQKVTNDDEGEGPSEGGRVTIPPKNDDAIYEQPLTTNIFDFPALHRLRVASETFHCPGRKGGNEGGKNQQLGNTEATCHLCWRQILQLVFS